MAALLVALALVAGGCASPTTGRVRDAQLLYGDWQRPAAIAEARQAGPFFEHVATEDGAARDSWRPFLHTRIAAAEVDMTVAAMLVGSRSAAT